MSLGSIFRRVVPIAVSEATGGPVAAFGTAVALKQQNQEEKKIKRQINEYNTQRQQEAALVGLDAFGGSGRPININSQATQSSGFGSSFGGFVSDVGRNIISPIAGLFDNITRFGRPQNVRQQPALTTITNVGARETQASGTSQAFAGGLSGLGQVASRFLRSPQGGAAIGLLGGGAASLLGGSSGQVRITRKTKRLAQQAYNLSMGNLSNATVLFAQLSGLEVSEQQFVLILTKRFRNDGPVITKAALRKTKTTIRRMKSMCDMYDSLRPAATRRRTPMKRAATTLISNK
jgi:hypothetical protein